MTYHILCEDKLMSSLGICVSFLLGNIFITSLSNCLSTNVSQTLPNEEHQEEKNKKKPERNLFCISASVQKDEFDELLGHSRLFLMLNMHPNTAFWHPNRGAGASTRWGSGTKCYRKYGGAAQSTTWAEAFGRWAMTFLKDPRNADCSSRCDATRCGSSTEDANSSNENAAAGKAGKAACRRTFHMLTAAFISQFVQEKHRKLKM